MRGRCAERGQGGPLGHPDRAGAGVRPQGGATAPGMQSESASQSPSPSSQRLPAVMLSVTAPPEPPSVGVTVTVGA